MTVAAPFPVSARARLYRQLSPMAREEGISPLNRVIIGLILGAVAVAVLETEPLIVANPTVAALFDGLNLLFALAFLLEYAARVWTAGENPAYAGWRGRLRYMRTPAALFDLCAILPFFLLLAASDSFLLRLLRLARILMLARLGRFSLAARLLAEAVSRRRYELMLSAALSGLILLVAATALHLVEGAAQPEQFGSIPRSLWWAVVTMTTIGYGDIYPVTLPGRILGGIAALFAVGCVAMPTGILAAAFSDAFQKHSHRDD